MKRAFTIVGLFCSLLVFAESNLVIEPLSGEQLHFAVQRIGQIRFENNSICLYDKENVQLGCTPTKDIKKITFYKEEEGQTELEDYYANELQVYSNPEGTQLVIHGLDGEQVVRIYSLHGQLLISTLVSDNHAVIRVDGLQAGGYLLQAGAQIVKFIKY